MNKKLGCICFVTLCLLISGCENESKPQEDKIIDEAIEIAESNYDSYSSGYDMVEKIYAEILKTDTALAQLEDSTNALLNKHHRLEKPFKSFDKKNNTYYTDAIGHLDNVNDSLLRQKYRALIMKSQANYVAQTQEINNIINDNELRRIKIKDLKIILKLTKTLPYIEKYQQKTKFNKDTLLGIDKELDSKLNQIQQFLPR